MFINEISSAFAHAATLAASSIKSSRAGTVTLNVRVGRVLAAAALFVAPALITPAHGGGLQIADPSGACASWSWTAATSTLTCNAATQTAGTPSGCSLSASPSSITAPTNITLTASCSSNTDANTTWAWSATGGISLPAASTTGASSQSQVVQNVGASTTFSVTATNASGAGPTRSAAVTLSTPGSGGVGTGGAISCAGYTSTIVMNFNYVPGSGQVIQTSQGMATTDILVATFTTPATIANGTGAGGNLTITNNAQTSAGFLASFSTTPCTFASNLRSGKDSASWSFTNTASNLKPNTQYFLNVKGDSPLSVKLLAK